MRARLSLHIFTSGSVPVKKFIHSKVRNPLRTCNPFGADVLGFKPNRTEQHKRLVALELMSLHFLNLERPSQASVRAFLAG